MINIHRLKTILVWSFCLSLVACNFSNRKNKPVWSELPVITRLEDLKQTDFVVTSDNPISEYQNIIYAPAFLYAWDKIKEELKSPIIADSTNSAEFILLNKSTSHLSTLTENEYSANAEIVNGALIAEAFFNKTLPFETKLQALDDPIVFDSIKVSAFGMMQYDEAVVSISQILYYKDDSHFILKLIPKDKQHEIILVKGLGEYYTLNEAIERANDLIAQGKKEQTDRKLSWKYKIKYEDIFAIPVINFNIETNFKNIEGQNFKTGNNEKHWVETAYQRIGFILNERGAVVENEAVATLDSTIAEVVVSQPKKMIFDNPFLVIVKRTDQPNPYFVMKVANAELLVKK